MATWNKSTSVTSTNLPRFDMSTIPVEKRLPIIEKTVVECRKAFNGKLAFVEAGGQDWQIRRFPRQDANGNRTNAWYATANIWIDFGGGVSGKLSVSHVNPNAHADQNGNDVWAALDIIQDHKRVDSRLLGVYNEKGKVAEAVANPKAVPTVL